MCGLFGFSGSKLPDVNALKLLAWANESRGKDATGIYGNGLWKTLKQASDAILDDKFDEAADAHQVIGHTRFSTMGHGILDNAHPYYFEFDDEYGHHEMAGTHNGWLPNLKWQADRLEMDVPPVDSMLIFQYLIKTEFNFYKLNKEIHGAAAIAFIVDKKRLYLYKRSSKPLYIGWKNEGMYYSSIEESLKMIRCKNIESLSDDTFLGFEDGVLVDERYYGSPDIVIPLNCVPSYWRRAVPKSMSDIIPVESYVNTSTTKLYGKSIGWYA